MKFALLSFCFSIMFFCQAQQLNRDAPPDDNLSSTSTSLPLQQLHKDASPADISSIIAENTIYDPDKIFDGDVEIDAEYPGGLRALRKYVAEQADNIGLYPKEAQEEKKEGRVVVRFVVDRDGSIGDFTVQRDDIGYGAAEKLIDILKTSEKWKPAQIDRKPVRSSYRFTTVFALPPEENTEESTEE